MGGVSGARDLLMVSLSRFYTVKTHMQTVLPYLTGRSSVSLRLIDWFVTNYSKTHQVVITRQENSHVVHFNVYLGYRAQLKAYSKQQFDPFRRRDRVMFYYDRTQSVETTIGQLNFFRWMLTNGVLDCVVANAALVEQDMLTAQKETKNAAAAATSDDNDDVVAPNGPDASALSHGKAPTNMTRLVGHHTVLFD
jgi:hypothetical protein